VSPARRGHSGARRRAQLGPALDFPECEFLPPIADGDLSRLILPDNDTALGGSMVPALPLQLQQLALVADDPILAHYPLLLQTEHLVELPRGWRAAVVVVRRSRGAGVATSWAYGGHVRPYPHQGDREAQSRTITQRTVRHSRYACCACVLAVLLLACLVSLVRRENYCSRYGPRMPFPGWNGLGTVVLPGVIGLKVDIGGRGVIRGCTVGMGAVERLGLESSGRLGRRRVIGCGWNCGTLIGGSGCSCHGEWECGVCGCSGGNGEPTPAPALCPNASAPCKTPLPNVLIAPKMGLKMVPKPTM
jgi:hypothetical protein